MNIDHLKTYSAEGQAAYVNDLVSSDLARLAVQLDILPGMYRGSDVMRTAVLHKLAALARAAKPSAETLLQHLRDERDSWLQANREIEVLLQAAQDNSQTKVVESLRTASQHSYNRWVYTTQLLGDLEGK